MRRAPFDMIGMIARKRAGSRCAAEEISAFVRGVAAGDIPDYQTSAWLMAVCFRGLDDGELCDFTRALADSGDRVTFPDAIHAVDKHSTGGVGDKTTLVVVPLAAACGVPVAKLSGRGLGFTGGTVDKLESIPGMNVSLSTRAFVEQVERISCAISGHSLELAPAEGKFYALRDVTGTVECDDLIASSIVSKKAVSGSRSFVFDVKCGSGAFMKDTHAARRLAEKLVDLSKKLGYGAVALVTAMDEPLGNCVGNSLEVIEAIEVLKGGGPEDLHAVCVELAAEMLAIRDVAGDRDAARRRVVQKLADGSALAKLAEMIAAQGGDPRVCDAPEKILPRASRISWLKSLRAGVIARLDAELIGRGSGVLGAGREKKGDPIDPAVGVRLLKKTGDAVEAGEAVMEIHANDPAKYEAAEPFFEKAFTDGLKGSLGPPVVLARIL